MSTVTVKKGQRAFLDGKHRVTVKYIGPVWSVQPAYSAAHAVKGGNSFASAEHHKSDVWIGIAHDQPMGKHGGKVNGIRYFTCKPKHGVFVRPHRLTGSEDEEPQPPPPRTKKKARGAPRMARFAARKPAADAAAAAPPPKKTGKKLRGAPRVAMLAAKVRKEREQAGESPDRKALPKHNVRLKRAKGPAAMFRQNVVASPKPPKVREAWGAPELEPAPPAAPLLTVEEDDLDAEALATSVVDPADAEAFEQEAIAAAEAAVMTNDEDLENLYVDDETNNDIGVGGPAPADGPILQRRTSADAVMDALQSEYRATRGASEEGSQPPTVPEEAEPEVAPGFSEEEKQQLIAAEVAKELANVEARLALEQAAREEEMAALLAQREVELEVEREQERAELEAALQAERQRAEEATRLAEEEHAARVTAEKAAKIAELRRQSLIEQNSAAEAELEKARAAYEQASREGSHWEAKKAKRAFDRAAATAALVGQGEIEEAAAAAQSTDNSAGVEEVFADGDEESNLVDVAVEAVDDVTSEATENGADGADGDNREVDDVAEGVAAEVLVAGVEEHEAGGDAEEAVDGVQEIDFEVPAAAEVEEVKAREDTASEESAAEVEEAPGANADEIAAADRRETVDFDEETAGDMPDEAPVAEVEEGLAVDAVDEAPGDALAIEDVPVAEVDDHEPVELVEPAAAAESAVDDTPAAEAVVSKTTEPASAVEDAPKETVVAPSPGKTWAEIKAERAAKKALAKKEAEEAAAALAIVRAEEEAAATKAKEDAAQAAAEIAEELAAAEAIARAEAEATAATKAKADEEAAAAEAAVAAKAKADEEAVAAEAAAAAKAKADEEAADAEAAARAKADEETAAVKETTEGTPAEAASAKDQVASDELALVAATGLVNDVVHEILASAMTDALGEAASLESTETETAEADTIEADAIEFCDEVAKVESADEEGEAREARRRSSQLPTTVFNDLELLEALIPKSAPISYRAKADFPGQEDGDLKFVRGDLITGVVVVDEDWMRGTSRGRQGIFPSSFVEPEDDTTKVNSAAEARAKRESESKAQAAAEAQAQADEVAHAKAQAAAREKAKAKAEERAREAAALEEASRERIVLRHVPRDDLPPERMARSSLILKVESEEEKQERELAEAGAKEAAAEEAAKEAAAKEAATAEKAHAQNAAIAVPQIAASQGAPGGGGADAPLTAGERDEEEHNMPPPTVPPSRPSPDAKDSIESEVSEAQVSEAESPPAAAMDAVDKPAAAPVVDHVPVEGENGVCEDVSDITHDGAPSAFHAAMTTDDVAQWLRDTGHSEAAEIVAVNSLTGQDLCVIEEADLVSDLQLNEMAAAQVYQQIAAAKPLPFSSAFTAEEVAVWLVLNGIPQAVCDELESNDLNGEDLVDLVASTEDFADIVPNVGVRKEIALLLTLPEMFVAARNDDAAAAATVSTKGAVSETKVESLEPLEESWPSEVVAGWAQTNGQPALARVIVEHELSASDVETMQSMTKSEFVEHMEGQEAAVVEAMWSEMHESKIDTDVEFSDFKIGYDCEMVCEFLHALGVDEAALEIVLENDLSGTDLYHADANDLKDALGDTVSDEQMEAVLTRIHEFKPSQFNSSFTAIEVAEWLDFNGFVHCGEPIVENCLDGSDVLELTENDWEDLGVTSLELRDAIAA